MYSSLLYGTKKFLLEKLTYNGAKLRETEIDVMVDGRPPSSSGELFIAIHPGGFRGTNPEILYANHQLNITITIRTAKVPHDRIGVFSVLDQKLGIGPLTQKIIELVHMNYIILSYAGQYITDLRNKWIEPLRFNSAAPPRLVGGEWFHSEGQAREEAIIQTISFADAVRVQFTDYQPITEGPPEEENLDGYVPPGITLGETVEVFHP